MTATATTSSSKGASFRIGYGLDEFPTFTSYAGAGDHHGIDECVGQFEVGCSYAVCILRDDDERDGYIVVGVDG